MPATVLNHYLQKQLQKSVCPHIALDDVGFLGQVQQHAVIRKIVVAVDAPVAGHAGNPLGFLSQGNGHHIQRRVVLGLDLFIVLFVFTLWRHQQEIVRMRPWLSLYRVRCESVAYFTLDFGHMNGVQDFGVVIDTEGSNHLTLVFLILFFVFNLCE